MTTAGFYYKRETGAIDDERHGSEHSIWIGAENIRGDQEGRVFWVTDKLHGVPMLYGLCVGVHFVDIDTGDSRILRVIVEQIQETHVCPNVIADCDDAVYDNTGAFAGELTKKLPQRYRTVWNRRIVLHHLHKVVAAVEHLRRSRLAARPEVRLRKRLYGKREVQALLPSCGSRLGHIRVSNPGICRDYPAVRGLVPRASTS